MRYTKRPKKIVKNTWNVRFNIDSCCQFTNAFHLITKVYFYEHKKNYVTFHI